jgi:hypothetical protein
MSFTVLYNSRVKFSKKNQSDYLKYTPEKVEEMISEMYVDPDETAAK